MENTNFYPVRSFVNNLRGFHAQNDVLGRYNQLITLTIKKFCEAHFDKLIALCEQDESITAICSLPIPELEQYWQEQLSVHASYSCNERPIFMQFMRCFSPEEVPIVGLNY